MDAIPWYRSPVFVSLAVSVVLQIAHALGFSSSFGDKEAAAFVDGLLNVVSILAAGYAGWKRWRSNVQPLAVSKPSADAKSLPKCHPVTVVLAMFVAGSLFGCAQLGVQAAQTNEQRAAALLGDFTTFQKAALTIGSDPTVPAQVRKAVLDAPIAVKPAVDQLDEALRTYREVALKLKAGTSTDEKLKIAADNLVVWITRVTPQIKQLRATIEGAHP